MLDAAKNSAKNSVRGVTQVARQSKAKLLSFRQDTELVADDVRMARDYIQNYWPKLQRFHPKDDESLLGVPNPYLIPSFAETTGFDYNELYYWDSYFMVQGICDAEHKDLVIGILENLLALYRRFKVIPNASRTYLTGRSQPPFLTTFIMEVYQAYDMPKPWLHQAMAVAEDEYHNVWKGLKKPNERLVYRDLSRYYDINYLHDLAEAESGWDMTPRFGRRALHYLPVDLNSLLYKYEADLARAARICGDNEKAKVWDELSNARKSTMTDLMWDRVRGLFFDFNFKKLKRGSVASLAAYFPLWAGLASEQQAKQLVKSLKRFENKGGLATTDTLPLGQFVLGTLPTQWAYPNGWAPLQYVVIRGLERYGYHVEARRVAMKWLKANLAWFNQYGVFLEKYNVVSPEKPPLKGVYPSQEGFGWTNSVFERLCQDYIDKPARAS